MLHTLSDSTAAVAAKAAAILVCITAFSVAVIVLVPGVDALSSTDASIKYVLKEAAYEVDVDVDSDHEVSVGVQNKGAVTADIDLVLLLRSTIGECKAEWNSQPGDAYVSDHVDSDGDTVTDTFLSEIDRTLPDMLPGEARDVTRSYTVRCFQKSFHDNAIRFEAGVVPHYPMTEENPSDNAHKQDIDITAWEIADVKKLGLFALDVTTDASENIVVTTRSVLHNNGPYGAPSPDEELLIVTDDIIVTGPGSCIVTPTEILDTPVELPVSVDVVLDQVFTVKCNMEGLHTIEWDDCIDVQNAHVRDPNPDNNCASLVLVFPGEQVPGPPVVGGVVGLLDAGPGLQADGPGSSGGDYAAPVAAAVLAGAVALAAGGWYACRARQGRRWLR